MSHVANSLGRLRGFALRATVSASLAIAGCATGPHTSVTAPRKSEAEQFYECGAQAAMRGDDVRAEHYFALAMKRCYPERTALLELMRLCLAGSRLRAALNYAEPYLRKHPRDIELRYLVATMYHGLGQTSAALEHLDQVLTIQPRHAEAHYLVGLVLSGSHLAASDVVAHMKEYLALAPRGVYAYEARQILSTNSREIAMEVGHDSE